jgi:hypothetical protein
VITYILLCGYPPFFSSRKVRIILAFHIFVSHLFHIFVSYLYVSHLCGFPSLSHLCFSHLSVFTLLSYLCIFTSLCFTLLSHDLIISSLSHLCVSPYFHVFVLQISYTSLFSHLCSHCQDFNMDYLTNAPFWIFFNKVNLFLFNQTINT